MESVGKIKKAIITFLILNFALSSIFYYLIIVSGMGGYSTLLLMWCPGVAALITSLLFFKSIKNIGWGPGKAKYLVLAYILPIISGGISYGIFWLFGLGTYTGDLPANILIFLVIGTVNEVIMALGEEIGWRGFLVPQLAKLTTFKWVAIISGVIWAVWHFPLMIFSTYIGGTPLWWSLTVFFVGTVAVSFVFAWLTLKSGSVWPAVLLHASDNLFTQRFFGPLASGSLSVYFVGEAGILITLVTLIFALIFWRLRDRLPDLRISGSDKNKDNI